MGTIEQILDGAEYFSVEAEQRDGRWIGVLSPHDKKSGVLARSQVREIVIIAQREALEAAAVLVESGESAQPYAKTLVYAEATATAIRTLSPMNHAPGTTECLGCAKGAGWHTCDAWRRPRRACAHDFEHKGCHGCMIRGSFTDTQTPD